MNRDHAELVESVRLVMDDGDTTNDEFAVEREQLTESSGALLADAVRCCDADFIEAVLLSFRATHDEDDLRDSLERLLAAQTSVDNTRRLQRAQAAFGAHDLSFLVKSAPELAATRDKEHARIAAHRMHVKEWLNDE